MSDSVSVVIPSYNCEKYIVDCVRSVLKQTCSPLEIIVVDDGSLDNTRAVLSPFIAESKLKYLHQKNKGAAAARNRGMRNATGEFIAFLDADDLWLPRKLEKQLPLFRDQSVGLVYSRAEWFAEVPSPSAMKECRGAVRHYQYCYRRRVYDALLQSNFIPTSCVVIRRNVSQRVGAFVEELDGRRFTYGEDYEYWLRVARLYEIDFVDEVLTRHRVHSNQVSANRIRRYKQLCSMYKHLLSQADFSEKFLIARKYFKATMKHTVTSVLRI